MNTKYLLIADADESIFENVSEEIQKLMDVRVMHAADGSSAYQKLRNQEFVAVISEFDLKKLNGAQLLASARDTAQNAMTPFIFYTEDLEAAKSNLRGQKGLAFFKKPSDIKLLCLKVEEMSKIDYSRKSFSLDVDFINPFIDASVKTLNDLCKIKDISAKQPILFQEQDLDVDISGTLKLSSPYFKGVIAISFNETVYKKMAELMLADATSEIKIDKKDGVSEIMNIIFGQAKAILNNHGYSLERAVPQIVTGHNHKISNNNIPVLLVPFESQLGAFWMQISVKAI